MSNTNGNMSRSKVEKGETEREGGGGGTVRDRKIEECVIVIEK